MINCYIFCKECPVICIVYKHSNLHSTFGPMEKADFTDAVGNNSYRVAVVVTVTSETGTELVQLHVSARFQSTSDLMPNSITLLVMLQYNNVIFTGSKLHVVNYIHAYSAPQMFNEHSMLKIYGEFSGGAV